MKATLVLSFIAAFCILVSTNKCVILNKYLYINYKHEFWFKLLVKSKTQYCYLKMFLLLNISPIYRVYLKTNVFS